MVMNLPARLRRWDVHGESLAVEGTAADVILDWIGDDEDETAQIQINRLMGVINTRRIFYFHPSNHHSTSNVTFGGFGFLLVLLSG